MISEKSLRECSLYGDMKSLKNLFSGSYLLLCFYGFKKTSGEDLPVLLVDV